MTGTPSSDDPSPSAPRDGTGTEAQLTRLFGSYKAEWLSEQLFELFTEPDYWPSLTTTRPCILVGGRGTGKTSVLRGLSYEGQYALKGRTTAAFEAMPFIGFYTRVDTNRVRAFDGPELEESAWVRVFAHYLNLSMALQVLQFGEWYERHAGGGPIVDGEHCEAVSTSLNLPVAHTQHDLLREVTKGLHKLEAEVNNVGDSFPTGLSLQKAPVDLLFESVATALPGKGFFFLFDEYENFTEYQQRIVNTFIKHADAYTFKVGVRELGLRTRATLNPDEQLISPADYVRVGVAEKLSGDDFKQFARQVCDSRLARVGSPSDRVRPSIEDVLPSMSANEEAHALGIAEILEREHSNVSEAVDAATLERFTSASALDQLLVIRWSQRHNEDLAENIRSFNDGAQQWRTRANNYSYSLLFTLRRGRGSRGIQKYYAGWDTLVALSAGNIRYVLELVEQSLLAHLKQGGDIGEGVDPVVQTRAAQAVGRKNLTELEGLSVQGARLTRLVLGLGRVFQLLAIDPLGHTPEINEFELAEPGEASETVSDVDAVDELLRSAVMHLALLRRPGSKVSLDLSDTRDFDYRLHPIFSAFFVFSHRHKRKMSLTGDDVVGLVRAPRKAIPEILKRHNRSTETDELPDQLQFFEAYYRGES